MELSIITTLYNSAGFLPEFYTRASAAARQLTSDYELIFVNDGSPDESLEVALTFFESDEHVRVIDLSRNFGHHKAMMTGLEHSQGDLVLLIDCDLEEDPELLERLHAELLASRADMVYGVQLARKGSLFERASGAIYYSVVNSLSSPPLPRNLITLRLMTRRYVAALLRHREREVNIAGLWAITGFRQQPLTVVKHWRRSSSYNLPRKLSVLVDSITSFSNRPLVFIFYLGCFISAAAGLAAAYLIVRRLFFGVLLDGWPSLIVSVWLLGGITIFCLGIIGIYLSKIFVETKQRPYTIVRQCYERRPRPQP
jgi:putative glycosyltransferase